jgi:hypothetical protein
MKLYTRLEKLERLDTNHAPTRLLVLLVSVGHEDDDIVGATIGDLTYTREDGESMADFKQRLEDCPQRPAVAIAGLTYRESATR